MPGTVPVESHGRHPVNRQLARLQETGLRVPEGLGEFGLSNAAVLGCGCQEKDASTLPNLEAGRRKVRPEIAATRCSIP